MRILRQAIERSTAHSVLTCYLPESHIGGTRYVRPGILILPGGGYQFTSDREAEGIALAFAAQGYNAYILNYDTEDGTRWPRALEEAMTAMRMIRGEAEAWKQDPARVAVIGFSAGGHLAADLACVVNDAELLERSGFSAAEVRPDAAILCYPVISSGPVAHRGSIERLLGEDVADEAKLARVSLETRVSADCPPCYIWHTANDEAVPVQNSLRFATALAEAGVPFELHVYPEGAHGLSLARWFVGTPAPLVRGWIVEAQAWLDRQFGIADEA